MTNVESYIGEFWLKVRFGVCRSLFKKGSGYFPSFIYMLISSAALGLVVKRWRRFISAVFWRFVRSSLSSLLCNFCILISSIKLPAGFSFGCILGNFTGGSTALGSFSRLKSSTLADLIPDYFFCSPSLLTFIPLSAIAYLYMLNNSAPSSDESESSLSSVLSIKISRQRGSFETFTAAWGVKSVLRGIFFFPFRLRLLMILFLFFAIFSIIPSKRRTKLLQS